jgi:hypothetical protein
MDRTGSRTHDGRDGVMAEGVPARELGEADLLRELKSLHDTRHRTFRHGSLDALARHTERTAELEDEYLRRRPGREVDPARLRPAGPARRAAR